MSQGPHAPLHAMNPLGRFSDRAWDYARHRPSYPREAIDAVLDGLGSPGTLLGADIGAGTGISARLLAERGVHVTAIEPNAAMRDAAGPHPLVCFKDGTAERTGLEDASVDLVVCAQAYHWFRPGDALAELARVLRAGGRLAVLWNVRDQHDGFTKGYTDLVRAAAGSDLAVDRVKAPDELRDSPNFGSFRGEQFAYSQPLDGAGLIGRVVSASYVPKEGPAHARLVAGLGELHRRYADSAGLVSLVYTTRVFLARRR